MSTWLVIKRLLQLQFTRTDYRSTAHRVAFCYNAHSISEHDRVRKTSFIFHAIAHHYANGSATLLRQDNIVGQKRRIFLYTVYLTAAIVIFLSVLEGHFLIASLLQVPYFVFVARRAALCICRHSCFLRARIDMGLHTEIHTVTGVT